MPSRCGRHTGDANRVLVNDPSFQGIPVDLSVTTRRGFTMRDGLAILFRRKRLVLRFFFAAVVAMAAYAVLSGSHPVHRAVQKVNIGPTQRVTASAISVTGTKARP